jgi:DNA-binding winged helix-turn-helix (wHTH) protein
MRESRERFLFGPFCLDAATGVLTKDGMPVPLGAMATQLLLYLVRHSERLTTHEELEQALWPDSAPEVSPKNTLARHISEVRTALGDNARRPHYVRTVQGKGYRFIQPVRRDEAAASGVTPQGQECTWPHDMRHIWEARAPHLSHSF